MPEKISFILSTGRTGTKTLAEGLSGKDIKSPHQPPFSRLITIASHYYLHGWLPLKLLTWIIKTIREPQIQNSDCLHYVQVFAFDYFPAKIFSEKYPNVHMVHIIRDPRDFVYSYLNWMHSRFKSFVANKIVLGWHPSGFFTGTFSRQEWNRLDEFQRVCWQWTYKNTLIENLFEDDPRYLRVRFEDLLLADNTETLHKLLSFLGIEYQERFNLIVKKPKNVSKKGYFPTWEQWTPKRCAQLNELCHPLMKQLGYGQGTQWKKKVRAGAENNPDLFEEEGLE
jgi:hypothetical protein